MDRLTTRNSLGRAVLKNALLCGRCNEAMWAPITAAGEDVADRLAAYEDAEEQGRLIVLPPKDEQTNADRIRAMSNKELRDFLPNICRHIKDTQAVSCISADCKKCINKWLGQPAEGGEQDGAD